MSEVFFEWVEREGERALRICDSEGHELFLSEEEADALRHVFPPLLEFLC